VQQKWRTKWKGDKKIEKGGTETNLAGGGARIKDKKAGHEAEKTQRETRKTWGRNSRKQVKTQGPNFRCFSSNAATRLQKKGHKEKKTKTITTFGPEGINGIDLEEGEKGGERKGKPSTKGR